MIINKQRLKVFYTVFLVWAFLIGSFPVGAQDLVASSDITGGASVFVFRGSSKSKQKKVAFQRSQKRSVAQRRETRKKVVRQSNTLARVTQSKRPTKRVDPQTLARMTPQIKTMPKEEASLIFAGAGEYFLERDDLEQAIGFFKESITLDSANKFGNLGLSDAYTRKGNEHLDNDENEKAKAYFEEAIKYDDKNANAYAGLGEIFDAMEQADAAIENYQKAIDLNPDLTEVYVPLGILYFEQSSIPGKPNEIAKADELLTKALAADPNDAQTQFFSGLIAYKQNDLDKALKALRRSIEINAENPEAHYYLGEIYGKMGNDREALTAYQKATGLNPKFVDAWFDLAVAQFNNEDYDGAINSYQKVVTLKNDYWEAHANLGDAYRLKNDYAKAEGSYRIAATRLKDDAELFSKFGFVLGRQGKWKASIEQLNQAVKLDQNGFDYANLGWAYYNSAQENLRMRRNAEAKSDLEQGKIALQKAVEMDPKNEAALLNLGITLTDLGDYQAAANKLEAATKLRKQWLPAVNELGLAYRQMGRLNDAIEQFRKVIEIDKNFAAGYYNLGEALYRNRKTDEARKVVDKLKPLNPVLAKRLEILMMTPVSR